MRRAVLVDLDHTLCNSAWRDHMIPDWDAFHSQLNFDEPHHDVAYLINALHNFGYTIIGLTGRTEKWRGLTMEWLTRHEVRMDELIMRPDRDLRKAPEVKLELANKRFASLSDEVAFLIEDRDDICAAFKGAGITVLQVHGRQK